MLYSCDVDCRAIMLYSNHALQQCRCDVDMDLYEQARGRSEAIVA